MPNKTNLFLVVLGVLAFLFALYAGYYAYSNYKAPSNKAQNMVQQEPVSEDLVQAVKDKSYDELISQNPDQVTNPNVANGDLRQRLVEDKVVAENPQNYIIEYASKKFTPETLNAKRGDSVTFKNNSDQEISIVGVSGWGTFIPIPPQGNFSQRFDIKGNYPYSSSTGGTAVIVVE